MSQPMLVTAEDRTDTLLEALSKAGYLDDDWRVERDDGDGRSKAENLTLAEFRKALAAAWRAGQVKGAENLRAALSRIRTKKSEARADSVKIKIELTPPVGLLPEGLPDARLES